MNESVEVRESEMKVTLGLRVEGKLERPVTVQLSTRDGTATGEPIHSSNLKTFIIYEFNLPNAHRVIVFHC